MLTILVYSLFTFAGAIATSVWQLAIFRLIAGIGIGGEWTLGGTFVAEEWPEDRRKMGAGLMQTGYYVGILIAAALNATVGARYGWRAMFAIGGLPAFLVLFIRYGVTEPEAWLKKSREREGQTTLSPRLNQSSNPPHRQWTERSVPLFRILSRPLVMIFSPECRRTILNSLYLLVSITGLWAGSCPTR